MGYKMLVERLYTFPLCICIFIYIYIYMPLCVIYWSFVCRIGVREYMWSTLPAFSGTRHFSLHRSISALLCVCINNTVHSLAFPSLSHSLSHSFAQSHSIYLSASLYRWWEQYSYHWKWRISFYIFYYLSSFMYIRISPMEICIPF